VNVSIFASYVPLNGKVPFSLPSAQVMVVVPVITLPETVPTPRPLAAMPPQSVALSSKRMAS
jgi:hypothetical protein